MVPLSSFSPLLIMFANITPDSDFDKYDEMRLHMEVLLSSPLIDFDISMRILIPLENAGIRRLRDLVCLSREDLLKVNRLGVKAVDEVERLLDRLGLSLGMII